MFCVFVCFYADRVLDRVQAKIFISKKKEKKNIKEMKLKVTEIVNLHCWQKSNNTNLWHVGSKHLAKLHSEEREKISGWQRYAQTIQPMPEGKEGAKEEE